MTRGACELPHQPLHCAVCAHLASFLHLLGQVFQEGTPPEQQVSDFCEASQHAHTRLGAGPREGMKKGARRFASVAINTRPSDKQ